MCKVISHSGRPLALAALLLLCGAKVAAADSRTGDVPGWLVGTWVLTDVREDKNKDYPEGEGPLHWYHSGNTMTVTSDRLTFVMDACEVGSVQEKREPIAVPIVAMLGVSLEAFNLPPEEKPVDYLAVGCAHSLLDIGDGKGIVHDRGIKLTWYVVRRSPTEIDMPFLGISYLKFRKAAPTS